MSQQVPKQPRNEDDDPFGTPEPKRSKKDKKKKKGKKRRAMLETRSYYYRPASRGL